MRLGNPARGRFIGPGDAAQRLHRSCHVDECAGSDRAEDRKTEEHGLLGSRRHDRLAAGIGEKLAFEADGKCGKPIVGREL